MSGIASYIPGALYLAKGTGGTGSAKYCYSVWLRHLAMAKNNGLDPWPKTVAELGPGDSLGIGLAALLSGCEKYFAFDRVEYANIGRNLEVFDELLALFRNRVDIPDEREFPGVKPHLENYRFPEDVLPETRMTYALSDVRLKKIRQSINQHHSDQSVIEYRVPWFNSHVVENASIDMIFSQAVLEHVDDLQGAYEAMRLWLKTDGYMSHVIDFKSHGTAHEWNGHWAYSDWTWKLITGRRPYLLNRQPRSKHVALLKDHGFKVLFEQRTNSTSKLIRHDLAERFRTLTEDDTVISDSFIQAIKTV
jgi:SAM-dependent methyltransferase